MTKQALGIKRIEFEVHAYKELLLRLQNHNSIEACGFLLGNYMGQTGVVSSTKLVRNANSSPFSFAIASYEYDRILRIVSQSNMEIIAVFHSHLDGSDSLSQADKASLVFSEYPWVIGSLIKTPGHTDFLLMAYNPCDGLPIPVKKLSE